MNYQDFRNFKMIKTAEYMQKIITDLPKRLNIFCKVSDKTHQGRTSSEPNHAHADKSQKSHSLCMTHQFSNCLLNYQALQVRQVLFVPPWLTTDNGKNTRSVWDLQPGGAEAAHQPWGAHTQLLLHSDSGSAVPRALVQSHHIKEIKMAAKKL